jgi:ribonuclease BN (tRNA processing enzyme)
MKMRIEKLADGEKFSLTNDGALEVFHLGVGSAFADAHNQMNFLIVKGDAHILIDCGTDGVRALRNVAGINPVDIEALFVSHLHDDHVNGVESLALRNRYIARKFMDKPKIKLIANREFKSVLWERKLRGGLEYNEELAEGKPLTLSDYFDVVHPKWKVTSPREIFEVDYKGIHLEIFRTRHFPEQAEDWEGAFLSYGLFIDGKVFHSIDTQFDRELIDLYADRSEVMFHDVQFFPDAVHAPLADLQTLDESIKKKMHLVHYADTWKEYDVSDFAGWGQQGVRYIFE